MSRNLLAGVVNSVWTAIVGFATVPLYLKYLGIEAYGLVGFFATTQAVISLLDMGLAPTINREVARCSGSSRMKEARTLLHTLAVIYVGIALLIALVVFILAPFIANHWLNATSLDSKTTEHAIALMGLVVACKWPMGLYSGALMGLQRQVVSSSINIIIVTVSNLGAVLVLAFISSTISAFFIWQAIAACLGVFMMRSSAWDSVGRDVVGGFEVNALKNIYKFSAGVSVVAFSAVILMQTDKIILSRILTLDEFGRYSLAGVLASGLYVLLTPLFNTVYPKMSTLHEEGKRDELIYLYKNGTRLFLALFLPIAFSASVFSEDLLILWTGDVRIALTTAPILSFLLIGNAFNGIMHFPYALQLASGHTEIPIRINTVLILVMLPMTSFLASTYSATGGAISWALLNFLYMIIGTLFMHRSIFREIGVSWFFGDVFFPLSVSFLLCEILGRAIQSLGFNNYLELILCIPIVMLSFVVVIFFSPNLKYLSKRFLLVKLKHIN